MKQFTSIFHEEVILIEESKADANRQKLRDRAHANSIRDNEAFKRDSKANKKEAEVSQRRQDSKYRKDKADYNRRESRVTGNYHLNKKKVDAQKESFLMDIDLV